MRKANLKTSNVALDMRLAEVRISEHDRERAMYAMRDAEAIVDAVIWVKEKIESLGELLLKPGLKH